LSHSCKVPSADAKARDPRSIRTHDQGIKSHALSVDVICASNLGLPARTEILRSVTGTQARRRVKRYRYGDLYGDRFTSAGLFCQWPLARRA
jgi:hypothetical protein